MFIHVNVAHSIHFSLSVISLFFLFDFVRFAIFPSRNINKWQENPQMASFTFPSHQNCARFDSQEIATFEFDFFLFLFFARFIYAYFIRTLFKFNGKTFCTCLRACVSWHAMPCHAIHAHAYICMQCNNVISVIFGRIFGVFSIHHISYSFLDLFDLL